VKFFSWSYGFALPGNGMTDGRGCDAYIEATGALGQSRKAQGTVEKPAYATLLSIFGRSQGAKRRS
jgi:hypothetical protein